MDSVERRRTPRFTLAFPVELDPGTGISQNISTSGMFFQTDQEFSPGAPIGLTLLMGPMGPGISTRLHFQGKIVRVEGREGKTGVAVAFTSYRFETLSG